MADKRAKHAQYVKEHRAEKGRPKRFYLDLTDKDSVICEKFEKARSYVGQYATNSKVLIRLLDFFIAGHDDKSSRNSSHTATSTVTSFGYSMYTAASHEDVDEPMFLATVSATQTLVNNVGRHVKQRQQCSGVSFSGHLEHMKGHCATLSFTCDSCDVALPSWPSSSYLPNDKFLVNYRAAHGYFCSGILPNQYERFSNSANMGCIGEKYLKDIFKSGAANYLTTTEAVYNNSCRDALLLEVGEAQTAADMNGHQYDGISIITDARHGWRKNSRQTDVVCIGQATHRVLTNQIVTKVDDLVAQRHEILGTQRIYGHLQGHPDGPFFVHVHAHDRNMAINKYVRENHPDVRNQNDVWHTTKALEKEVSQVSKGPQYKHGETWHMELTV